MCHDRMSAFVMRRNAQRVAAAWPLEKRVHGLTTTAGATGARCRPKTNHGSHGPETHGGATARPGDLQDAPADRRPALGGAETAANSIRRKATVRYFEAAGRGVARSYEAPNEHRERYAGNANEA